MLIVGTGADNCSGWRAPLSFGSGLFEKKFRGRSLRSATRNGRTLTFSKS
jgi:hypothetical protein